MPKIASVNFFKVWEKAAVEKKGLKYSGLLKPIPSMYGTFTYIYHTNQPNVGK